MTRTMTADDIAKGRQMIVEQELTAMIRSIDEELEKAKARLEKAQRELETKRCEVESIKATIAYLRERSSGAEPEPGD